MHSQRKTDQNSVTIMKAAEEYVQQQVATMKAHGQTQKLSQAAFNAIVQQVARASNIAACPQPHAGLFKVRR